MLQEPSATHLFSKHDNRHSFMNDALYFEEVSANIYKTFSENW